MNGQRSSFTSGPSQRAARAALWVVWSLCGACQKQPTPDSGPAASQAVALDSAQLPKDLPKDQAERVLAKVGERTLTLADYENALANLDHFEQLRYQTPERRRQLLDELINTELLAREAERRGLATSPVVQAELRVLLREEAIRRLRSSLPPIEELPASEVRARYEARSAEFQDPERRRVAVLRVNDRNLAEKLLPEALAATPEQWGELVRKHSRGPVPPAVSKNEARPPREFEGDLGLVSAPGETTGANPAVVEPVRRAVFELTAQGAVFPSVVSHGAEHYLVRLLSIDAKRHRTFAEVEPTLRVQLLQEKLQAAEAELLSRLRREHPVTINEQALQRLSAASEKP